MTSRDFCFWLQGALELRPEDKRYEPFTPEQMGLLQRHLNLVFIHEIDPSAGDVAHQAKLNEAHKPPAQEDTKPAFDSKVWPFGPVYPNYPNPADNLVMRC